MNDNDKSIEGVNLEIGATVEFLLVKKIKIKTTDYNPEFLKGSESELMEDWKANTFLPTDLFHELHKRLRYEIQGMRDSPKRTYLRKMQVACENWIEEDTRLSIENIEEK